MLMIGDGKQRIKNWVHIPLFPLNSISNQMANALSRSVCNAMASHFEEDAFGRSNIPLMQVDGGSAYFGNSLFDCWPIFNETERRDTLTSSMVGGNIQSPKWNRNLEVWTCSNPAVMNSSFLPRFLFWSCIYFRHEVDHVLLAWWLIALFHHVSENLFFCLLGCWYVSHLTFCQFDQSASHSKLHWRCSRNEHLRQRGCPRHQWQVGNYFVVHIKFSSHWLRQGAKHRQLVGWSHRSVFLTHPLFDE